ncbi:uncharacterized protein LOC132042519 [Lycium ferocissimum]|uniref:uncharacterized protein LOC132042519 n=1 Tax=Lycium ferocissimum TaxID=112874 RepID=UPI002815BB46|nr:uncharacterized protein LOC132042519 [Lycium ferocissimum]
MEQIEYPPMKDIVKAQDHPSKFKHSRMPQMNGAVKAPNKNIKRILRKMTDNHKVEIPFLRIIQQAELDNAEWVRARYEQLAFIDEKRIVAICHDQLYQQRIARAFNKQVRTRVFQIEQLVLKQIFSHQEEYEGKFAPNWQGPYIIRKVLFGGALVLEEMDDPEWPKPINSDAIKRYYA